MAPFNYMTVNEYKIAVKLLIYDAECLEYHSNFYPNMIDDSHNIEFSKYGYKFSILSQKAWEKTGNSIIGLGHTELAAWKYVYNDLYKQN